MIELFTAIGGIVLYVTLHILCILAFYRWICRYDENWWYRDEPPPDMVFLLAPVFLIGGLFWRAFDWLLDLLPEEDFNKWLGEWSDKYWEDEDE